MADEETEDGRIRNREAMAKIRDAWVYKQVRERVPEFTEYHQVSSANEQSCALACSLNHVVTISIALLVLTTFFSTNDIVCNAPPENN